MKHYHIILLLFCCIFLSNQQPTTLFEKTLTFKAMGSAFILTAIHADSLTAIQSLEAAKQEIYRIENLISSWKSTSQTSIINHNAGIRPIKVDIELYNLIQRSLNISKITDGAFDISYASMDKIWKFDGTMKTMPTPSKIQQAISTIGYQNIILNNTDTTIFLKEKGMKIGFGAIGKGYAADMAKKIMQTYGIQNGLVNAGGDLIAWGKPLHQSTWMVGIASPTKKGKVIGYINLENRAVVTSGDYEKFVTFHGKRYAHIINPKTGYPTTGIKSVTVICPITEMADALATAIFVMGIDTGLHLINQLKGIECIIITDDNTIIQSDQLKLQN